MINITQSRPYLTCCPNIRENYKMRYHRNKMMDMNSNRYIKYTVGFF